MGKGLGKGWDNGFYLSGIALGIIFKPVVEGKFVLWYMPLC